MSGIKQAPSVSGAGNTNPARRAAILAARDLVTSIFGQVVG